MFWGIFLMVYWEKHLTKISFLFLQRKKKKRMQKKKQKELCWDVFFKDLTFSFGKT